MHVRTFLLFCNILDKKGIEGLVMEASLSGNTVLHITGGFIEEIDSDRGNTLVTISYTERSGGGRGRQREQRLRLVVNRSTVIMDEKGKRIPAGDLKVGMVINASVSSAMTRSIPPQSAAHRIRIISRPMSGAVTLGRIIDIDRRNRSFMTISDGNRSSLIRFRVERDTVIEDLFGRPMAFSGLIPGLRVRVSHGSFMTASVPPQATALEVRVIR